MIGAKNIVNKNRVFLEKSNKGAKKTSMDFLIACSEKVNLVFEHLGKNACFCHMTT